MPPRGRSEGSVFLAEEQSRAGRGAHSWHSARSSGFMFVILRRDAASDALIFSLRRAGGAAAWRRLLRS